MKDNKEIDINKIGDEISKIFKKKNKHNPKSIKRWEKESVESGNMRCYLNKEWKERWLPFIKYDWDWDFAFIETLIAHKLKLMKEFYSNDNNTTNAHKSNVKKVKEINSVIKLYNNLFHCSGDINEERKQRLQFYTQLALLSPNWWD